MGKRTWIDSDIWNDTDGLTNAEQVLYFWLLTNSQRNIAGYYKINLAYASANITVVRKGKVRRAKLYYLRGLTGKAAKVKEKI